MNRGLYDPSCTGFGGQSPEYEVSIVSARNVHRQLQAAGYDAIPVGIDPGGNWHCGSDAFDILMDAAGKTFSGRPDMMGFQKLLDQGVDVLFPLVHGVSGEDGYIQGLCRLAGLPFVGGDVLNLSLCWDKIATRTIARAHGLPQPEFVAIGHDDWEPNGFIPKIEAIMEYPVFVKPSRAGSSIGISKVKNRDELAPSIEEALKYDFRVIVEQGLNAREIEIAGLGASNPTLSVPAEIIPGGEFYDFEEKYIKDQTKFIIPATFSQQQLEDLRSMARKAWKALSCFGMARIDFLVTPEVVYLNEINTIPGFTPISMYPALLERVGISQPQLMTELVNLALKRDTLLAVTHRFDSKEDWFKG